MKEGYERVKDYYYHRYYWKKIEENSVWLWSDGTEINWSSGDSLAYE